MLEERLNELILLQNSLTYMFNNPELLDKALTHKSYVHEIDASKKNNERFEFLGDSVLDLVVSDYMVRKYEELTEGTLSKIRASVVNESCLAELAQDINLGKFLLLGRGENISGGRKKPSILADAYEAVVGAVFFDSNLQEVSNAFLPKLIDKIDVYKNSLSFRDFKSDLQEYTQNRFSCIPSYRVIGEEGPDHDKRFKVEINIRDNIEGIGNGKSKKGAEQMAAQMALKKFLSKEG